MPAVFAGLARGLPPRHAYNLGFSVYWAGWCVAFPVWVVGPRRALDVLRRGRRPTPPEAVAALLSPVVAAATQLWPQRRRVDRGVAAVMVGTAIVNAVGEELLWRGLFLEEFPR